MTENVVLIRFEEPSKTYEALDVLKKCDHEGRIELQSAVIVERRPTGELHTLQSWDDMGPVGTASGSLIGMLVGVLGGPVGMLLGATTGAVLGGAFDIDRSVTSDEALTTLGRAIPSGAIALLAQVDEPAVEVIDAEMDMLGGTVERYPVAEVLAELGAAEDAAEAAAREARRVVREQRKAKLSAGMHEQVGKAKEKLHVS
jgi:uncharacterized membrane protein